ncbi:hypothetical protein RJ640_003526 [Escallonia rubra]|uniref:Uncharacterized protein n=1 Tax=Escallonia rubra TaxID=112253 RepID=A0AA88UFU7_9ASTE|nr:hypothetical protein RJ640_003526 [Escallonia rubra]
MRQKDREHRVGHHITTRGWFRHSRRHPVKRPRGRAVGSLGFPAGGSIFSHRPRRLPSKRKCATITEFTSNNATTTLLVPLLIQIANTMRVHPLLLMIPGAIVAQFIFLLQERLRVGFSTGHIDIQDMIKTGLPVKIAGTVALSILMPTLGAFVFGTDKQVNIAKFAYPK